jgi:hypothetical protein
MRIFVITNIGLFLLIFVVHIFSCSDDSPTNTAEEKSGFVSYQIPGCNFVFSFGKASSQDSCFSYSFHDTLKIAFCVVGNCCPDSDRFVTNYNINSDTLSVSVLDTAANLCDCIYPYTIQVEISGLLNDRYLFYCNYEDMAYSEIVTKSN